MENRVAKKPRGLAPGVKLRDGEKVRRLPVQQLAAAPKPRWLRVRLPRRSAGVSRIRQILRRRGLVTVCEEASCPNLGECFSNGTATFMIMGDICTRRCPFCDVAHGRPLPLRPQEPQELAAAIAEMGLRYVVITSVDRDDLPDGGGAHFAACMSAVRERNPSIRIEILVPDFRNRMEQALPPLIAAPADVFNHNLETVPSLYRRVRPGADYRYSLRLLAEHKRRCPAVPTKSGLMLGLGEERKELLGVLKALRQHNVDMLTLGQYLQPSRHHLPVERFVHPDEFKKLADTAREMGFQQVASAPLVRSSYHADEQAKLVGEEIIAAG